MNGADPDAVEPSAVADATVDRVALARAVNDLQATEARIRRNAERVYDEARSKLVLELLPVVDNLDRALQAAHGEASPLVEGIVMVRAQLEAVLVRYGVERIDAKGQKFDPAAHEAVAAIRVTDASQAGMVVEQIEPGYRFGSKLLRPARVGVGVLS